MAACGVQSSTSFPATTDRCRCPIWADIETVVLQPAGCGRRRRSHTKARVYGGEGGIGGPSVTQNALRIPNPCSARPRCGARRRGGGALRLGGHACVAVQRRWGGATQSVRARRTFPLLRTSRNLHRSGNLTRTPAVVPVCEVTAAACAAGCRRSSAEPTSQLLQARRASERARAQAPAEPIRNPDSVLGWSSSERHRSGGPTRAISMPARPPIDRHRADTTWNDATRSAATEG